MARVLVLTDRLPQDPEWKGALIWQTILSLAESQHEVLAVTPCNTTELTLTHPRLTIVQPIRSWNVDQLPWLMKTFFHFKPEVVHTFALKPNSMWASLTLWPWLHSACQLIPGLQRWSTFFEAADCREGDAAFQWHQGARGHTVLIPEAKLEIERRLNQGLQVTPFHMEWSHPVVAAEETAPVLLVPAPIGEWQSPLRDLSVLTDFLLRHPHIQARIVGGWGSWPLKQRKKAWQLLHDVAPRVSFTDPCDWPGLAREMSHAQGVWLECLRADQWRYSLALQLGQALNRKTHPELKRDSLPTALVNVFSRLYAR